MVLPLGLCMKDGLVAIGESLLHERDLRVHFVERLLLIGCGGGDDGRRVSVFDAAAGFGDLIEVSVELVELFLREGIEFVVVAAGAAEREAEENG